MGRIPKKAKRMIKVRTVQAIHFQKDRLILLMDEKEYRFNLADISPKLRKACKKERESYKISPSGYGIHWPLLDEDLSIEALINSLKRDTTKYLS
jgi:hypothetical protein